MTTHINFSMKRTKWVHTKVKVQYRIIQVFDYYHHTTVSLKDYPKNNGYMFSLSLLLEISVIVYLHFAAILSKIAIKGEYK